MPNYFVSPQGSDQNSGTSESQAWKSLENSSRLQPGDTLTALPGTITGSFRPPSGSAAAPITFRAKEPDTVTVDGSVRIDGLSWSRIAQGYQTPFSRLPFNVFQRDFEAAGKLANFNNRDFNQYGSNPQFDLHGTPAEFKWAGGNLRLNAIPGSPSAEPLFAAVVETAINLNGRSHVVVEGITTRGHKHAVATNGGTGIHLKDCRFTFCGSTAVWLVGLADASMVGCVVQGSGSWGGHYEDCVHTERVGKLRIAECNLSYGGHSGLIMLDGVRDSKITLIRNHFHHMGGSLLTLKRSVDGLLVEECWFADAAKSTAVNAHKVPHAGIQLSGKGHVFKNCVFRDNGKDILASSDGNADSNPVCSDNTFDHCTFSGSEAGAVEGQEYAPGGRMERNTWRDCIVKGGGDVLSLWFAGAGSRQSNVFQGCQIVGKIRGTLGSFDTVEAARASLPAVYANCSSNTIAGAGSSLTEPPTTGSGGENGGGDGGTQQPILQALSPTSGPPGTRVTATGSGFPTNAAVIVTTPKTTETPQGKRRVAGAGNDTRVTFTIPPDAITGDVQVRRGTELSNALVFTVDGE